MARKHMSRMQLIEANKILSAHLKVIGEGIVEYEQGWSDEIIAKMLGEDISKHSVAAARLELFGKFVRTMPNGVSEERFKKFEEDVNNLEKGIKLTMDKLDAISLKHKKLCENLTLNRVIDVKHLA